MNNRFWRGYSNEERSAAINTIQRAVLKYGSITDFKPFSDLALTLIIETETTKVNALFDELKSNMAVDGHDPDDGLSQKETTIFLNVTFSKGTGNLRIGVPEVPG